MTMPEANTLRHDPYKNFKFRVTFAGRPVAGVAKVNSPLLHTSPEDYRALSHEGLARKITGSRKSDSITLERGITHDAEFARWASEARGSTPRNDVTIELCDEMGKVVKAWTLRHCRVSEFQALPELDANGNAVTITHLRLETEGWNEQPEHASNGPKF